MSVLNRIPMFDYPIYIFEIPLFCPEVYTVRAMGNYVQPSQFVNYIDAADGRPIYYTRDSSDIQVPRNFDNSIYNLYKQYPSRMDSYGHVDNYAYIAIPLINWNEILKDLPYFNSYTYSMSVKVTDTLKYSQESPLLLNIRTMYFGHVVETDQIISLGTGGAKQTSNFWTGDQPDEQIFTGNFPKLLYKGYNRYHTIIYKPEEIDQVWACIIFPFGGGRSSAAPDSPTDPDYRYKMYIKDFFVTCRGYNPTVYRDQEPYE